LAPINVEASYQAILEAVRSGQISETRIDESVRKILRMKASVGLDRTRLVDLDQVAKLTAKPEDMEFAQHVADEAVTLVRHRGRMLPLQNAEPVAQTDAARAGEPSPQPDVVGVVLGQTLESINGREFEKALRARRPNAQVLYFDNRSPQKASADILNAVGAARNVVVAAYVAHTQAGQVMNNGKASTSFGLLGPSGDLLRHILAAAPEKTAVVAFGSPYLIESFTDIQTYVCTYAMASTSEVSAVRALFGDVQNHAKLPVTLPGVAARGFAMPWPAKANQPVALASTPSDSAAVKPMNAQ
jgi:beta-N-acetylhexosaminidase